MNSEIIVLLHRAYWLEIKIDVNERTTQRKYNLDETLNCSFYFHIKLISNYFFYLK